MWTSPDAVPSVYWGEVGRHWREGRIQYRATTGYGQQVELTEEQRAGARIDWPGGFAIFPDGDRLVRVDLLFWIGEQSGKAAAKSKIGRKPKPSGATVGERRLALVDRGISMEQQAEQENVDVDVVRRSIQRAIKRRSIINC